MPNKHELELGPCDLTGTVVSRFMRSGAVWLLVQCGALGDVKVRTKQTSLDLRSSPGKPHERIRVRGNVVLYKTDDPTSDGHLIVDSTSIARS
jgi:hypothetical protein